jgi:transposase-like protein
MKNETDNAVSLAVCCIDSCITGSSSAETGSLQDNLVPQDEDAKQVGEVDLKYNEYPQHHYKLDTWVDTEGDWMLWNWADGAGKQIYIALMEIINSIWNVNVLLANFTMKIVQEGFELDFVSNVTEQLGAAIQNIAGFGPGGFMQKGLWPLLVTFVIGIVGAWATYVGMIKRESSRTWGGLISSIVIFVFSLGFFSNAPTILKGVNDWSSDLQSNILAVSASVVNPGSSYTKEEGIATIRNQMFDLMVKKPYMLMQYGTTEVDESRVKTVLSIEYRCQNCNEVFSASFESVASHQHYTQRFRLFIYEQVLGTTIQDISRKYQIAYSTVERIFYSVADEKARDHQAAIEEKQANQEITLSLDEVAVRKGHKYETVLYDANLGAVMGMHQHRDFHSTLELLTLKVFHPEQVKNVVVDMWDPFHIPQPFFSLSG